MTKQRWIVSHVDAKYDLHLALTLSAGDLVRAKELRRLPLFDIATRGHLGLRSCAPRPKG